MNRVLLKGAGNIRLYMPDKAWHCLLLLCFMLPCSIRVHAQEKETITVTGKVLSATDREGVPGASVQIKGTTTGTVADVDGNFSVEAPTDGVLTISAIGFSPEEVAVSGRNNIVITLNNTKANTLGDVVVVGYGTTKKKDLTGAVSTVKMDDLKDLPQANIEQMLQGRVAGLTVGNNTGAPGGASSVKIRGVGTIGSTEPLYVIDGVMMDDNGATFNPSSSDASAGQNRTSPLSLINPNDIESIDVLKDASATAIYGSRASNGVIIVTTKKGKAGTGKISYNFFYGRQNPSRYLPVLNLQQYAQYSNNIADLSGTGRNPEYADISILGKGTDWQREIFQGANMQSHQLSVSGGNEKSKYYISGGYYKQDGIMVGSGYKRYTGRFTGDQEVNSWLKIGSSVTYAYTDERQTASDNSGGVLINALRQTPNVPVRFPDGSYGGPTINENDPSGTDGVISGGNPVAQAMLIPTLATSQKILGNVYGDIRFLKHFTLHNQLGFDINQIDRSKFTPTYEWGQSKNEINSYQTQLNKSLYWQLSNYLTYSNDFGKHSLSVMMGHEASKSNWDWLQGYRSNFPTNDIRYLNMGDASTATNTNGGGHYAIESYFGRATYNYDERYLLTATIRRDASSKFGPSKQAGWFPSVSGAWVFSQENFLKDNNKVLSFGKLRLGYGAVGNQGNIPVYGYGASLRSIAADPGAFASGGTSFMVNNIANPNLQWESQYTLNGGIDLSFFNRINLTVDIYDKRSKDFLIKLPLPYYMGTGVPGQEWYGIQAPYVNAGEMQNKGIDISLNATIINSTDFTWNFSGIFSKYKNKLLKLDKDITLKTTADFNQTVGNSIEGAPIGQFYGYEVEGIYQTMEQLQTHARKENNPIDAANGTYLGDIMYKDQNGDSVINGDDRVLIGSPHPKFTYGFTNSFTYKGFDFSFFFQGSYGAKILNYNRKLLTAQTGRENQLTDVLNAWTPENTNTDVPRYIAGDPNDNNAVSSRYVEDGSYLRLQNITLGYTVPKKYLSKTKIISSVRAYMGMQNVFTLTKYTGLDPEIGAYNGDPLRMNVDYGHYPAARTFTIGANVTF